MKRWLLFLLALTLYLLHQDYWNWTRVEPLVFGFLPIGLAYHAGFSIAATVMMVLFVKFAWPKHLEGVAGGDEGGGPDEENGTPRSTRAATGEAPK